MALGTKPKTEVYLDDKKKYRYASSGALVKVDLTPDIIKKKYKVVPKPDNKAKSGIYITVNKKGIRKAPKPRTSKRVAYKVKKSDTIQKSIPKPAKPLTFYAQHPSIIPQAPSLSISSAANYDYIKVDDDGEEQLASSRSSRAAPSQRPRSRVTYSSNVVSAVSRGQQQNVPKINRPSRSSALSLSNNPGITYQPSVSAARDGAPNRPLVTMNPPPSLQSPRVPLLSPEVEREILDRVERSGFRERTAPFSLIPPSISSTVKNPQGGAYKSKKKSKKPVKKSSKKK